MYEYMWPHINIFKPRHEKAGIKIFVVVIPKEGLVGISLAKPSFGKTPTIALTDHIVWYDNEKILKLVLAWRSSFDARHEKKDLKVFVVVIPKEGLAGWGPINPSLGMTPTINNTLLPS